MSGVNCQEFERRLVEAARGCPMAAEERLEKSYGSRAHGQTHRHSSVVSSLLGGADDIDLRPAALVVVAHMYAPGEKARAEAEV